MWLFNHKYRISTYVQFKFAVSFCICHLIFWPLISRRSISIMTNISTFISRRCKFTRFISRKVKDTRSICVWRDHFFRISTWRDHFIRTHMAGALDQTYHIKPTCTWRDHWIQKITQPLNKNQNYNQSIWIKRGGITESEYNVAGSLNQNSTRRDHWIRIQHGGITEPEFNMAGSLNLTKILAHWYYYPRPPSPVTALTLHPGRCKLMLALGTKGSGVIIPMCQNFS